MANRGVNGTDVKNRNRGLLLKLIACGQAKSRSDLTRLTRLTKMTVSNIVSEFLDAGILSETEELDDTQLGRKPVILALAPGCPQALGIYLSRDALTGGLLSLDGRLILSRTVPLAGENAETVSGKLTALAADLIRESEVPVLGIGVASIGPVDARKGILLHPTDFFGISRLEIKARLEAETGLPTAVNNDTNASALAEQFFGQGRTLRTFVYLGLSNGLSAGIVSGGDLYQDRSGFAGEAGHISIDCHGPLCACGNRGCLETYIRIPRLLRELGTAAGLSELPSAYQLCELYKLPQCREILDHAAEMLSYGMVSLSNLLAPEAIILGHESYFLPEEILVRLEDTVNRRVLFAGEQEIRVLRSSFENIAPLYGAGCCVLDRFFRGSWELAAPKS